MRAFGLKNRALSVIEASGVEAASVAAVVPYGAEVARSRAAPAGLDGSGMRGFRRGCSVFAVDVGETSDLNLLAGNASASMACCLSRPLVVLFQTVTAVAIGSSMLDT